MHLRIMMRAAALGYFLAVGSLHGAAQEYEREPINYDKTTPSNAVSRLMERMQAGEVQWRYEPEFGYLRAVLEELQIPESSQVLVFSKTSLQRHRISPRTPRALYFNDETYVGFCQNGEVLEISTADPRLGTVFYTIEQRKSDTVSIVRQQDNCLICHGSSQTREVPGHVVRSVFVDSLGMPLLASGTYRINQTSPLENRWGGWYVTGTHGEQKHLGNLVVRDRGNLAATDNAAGMNLTDLEDRIANSAYLTPHSDIVALMVLEHQTDAHNLITRANFQTRQAVHYQEVLNRELKQPADYVWDSARSRIQSSCEALLEYLLYSGEAKLSHRIEGTSRFAQEFAQRGPRDRRGRSLRDFDLETRIFKYPCSYLIYSPGVASLPREAKDFLLQRLWEVLSGNDQSPKYAHLTPADRLAILEILRDTLPDLPEFWRGGVPKS